MAIFQYLLFSILILGIAIISIIYKKLTTRGGIAAAFVGIAVYTGSNYKGLAMLGAFFILGTLATAWRKNEKMPLKAKTDRSSARNAGQVMANGGLAAIMGILAILFPLHADVLKLMLAASLSSAIADTLSSELGMLYGHRFLNILNFKPEQKGLDGVVSIEGILIGLAGSSIIAIIYVGENPFSVQFLLIILAGTIGNLADSILGATLERRKFLSNDQVNFFNTLIAALFMFVCSTLFL